MHLPRGIMRLPRGIMHLPRGIMHLPRGMMRLPRGIMRLPRVMWAQSQCRPVRMVGFYVSLFLLYFNIYII